jgi:hypothetical protein
VVRRMSSSRLFLNIPNGSPPPLPPTSLPLPPAPVSPAAWLRPGVQGLSLDPLGLGALGLGWLGSGSLALPSPASRASVFMRQRVLMRVCMFMGECVLFSGPPGEAGGRGGYRLHDLWFRPKS